MFRNYHSLIAVVVYLILFNTPISAINKISVSGIVENFKGNQLVEAQLTMKRQKKSATTNRFGEFDLGKIFPDDTLLVTMDGYQYQYLVPKENMEIKLYPKSSIQDKINRAREVGVGNNLSHIKYTNGKQSGQEIPHVHVHLIPRSANDSAGPVHSMFTDKIELTDSEKAELDNTVVAVIKTVQKTGL